MKFRGIATTVLCTLLLIATAGVSLGDTKGRILTSGKVTMYKNGKAVNSFIKQGPIDDGALIACEGNCLVKVKGISLIAEDKSRFALKEAANSFKLYVETGKVHFAVSDLTKEFSFYSPNNYYVQSKGFITSAGTSSSAKGFMQVSESEAKIAMEEGTMIIDADSASDKTIGPGQSILLAMAEVPEEEDDDDKAAAVICPFFSWGCKTGVEKVAFVGSGAALTAGLTILIDELNEDDPIRREAGGDDDTVVTPPTSPSPNR